MNIEVLLSTMNQKDMSIIDKMNIQGDAIIINQCDSYGYIEKNGTRHIKMYSFNEKGIGKSRNNALMRSTADICLMADDDMVYVDGYEDIVAGAFESNPKADMIVFNVKIHNKDGSSFKVKANERVRWFNCLKYGTVTFAFRRKKIIKNNIYFSSLFGGAKYGSGEDSIFIWDCLRHGMKIYSDTTKIADVYNYESTWFNGYDEKYFINRGALFAAISKTMAHILILQFLLRKRSIYKNDMGILDAYKYMLKGMKEFRNI